MAKRCKSCNKLFKPTFNSLQVVCSILCSIEWANTSDSKIYAVKAFKAETRDKKKKLVEKDRSYWTKKCQIEFNKFIRLRDKDLPCISSGKHHTGQYHAGHYMSVGGHSSLLRFHEDNCHKQSSFDNNHKSGNLVEYRVRLIEKIGLERVEWLEGPHKPMKYTIDELKDLTKHYRKLNKELS